VGETAVVIRFFISGHSGPLIRFRKTDLILPCQIGQKTKKHLVTRKWQHPNYIKFDLLRQRVWLLCQYPDAFF